MLFVLIGLLLGYIVFTSIMFVREHESGSDGVILLPVIVICQILFVIRKGAEYANEKDARSYIKENLINGNQDYR